MTTSPPAPNLPPSHPAAVLFGATSIVGYNIALRHHPDVLCYVTSRSKHQAVAYLPRLALHSCADLSAFTRSMPPNPIIIYCDAVCDVAKCEQNPAWAERINIDNLQRTLDALPAGARLVYMSSDHVFGQDGTYDEHSAPCPISLYGGMRVKAEQLALTFPNALVIRSGLPIGQSIDGKSGHLQWLQYRLTTGLPVTIVEDESRTPVPLPHLADRIVTLAHSTITGIRHITTGRVAPRPTIAQALKQHYGLPGDLAYSLRKHQPAPHLGRIHIITRHSDPLAELLPCPLELLQQPLPTGHTPQ